jgi:hypothetical protein
MLELIGFGQLHLLAKLVIRLQFRRQSKKLGILNEDGVYSLLYPCFSQSSLITDFTSLPPSKSGLKLVCNVNIVYRNLKYQNSQDYAQKPQ